MELKNRRFIIHTPFLVCSLILKLEDTCMWKKQRNKSCYRNFVWENLVRNDDVSFYCVLANLFFFFFLMVGTLLFD